MVDWGEAEPLRKTVVTLEMFWMIFIKKYILSLRSKNSKLGTKLGIGVVLFP